MFLSLISAEKEQIVCLTIRISKARKLPFGPQTERTPMGAIFDLRPLKSEV